MAESQARRAAPESDAATPSLGGRFVFRTRVLDASDLRRALTRIAHEIVERNHGADDVVLDRAPHPRRRARAAPRRGDRVVRGDRRPGRHAGRRVLPRRHRPAPGATARADRGAGRRDRSGSWCWSTTCSSPAAPSGPRSTRSPSSAGRARSSSRCWSTAVTGSCRSAPTSSGKNLPTGVGRGRAGPARRDRRRGGRRDRARGAPEATGVDQ